MTGEDNWDWRQLIHAALNRGEGKRYDLTERHLDRAVLVSDDPEEVIFTVLRHPSLFDRSRISFYVSAILPTVQRYTLSHRTGRVLLVEETPGEPSVSWDFLISEEVSLLMRQGFANQFLFSTGEGNKSDAGQLEKAVRTEIDKIGYAEIISRAGISPALTAGLASEVCRRLLPALLRLIDEAQGDGGRPQKGKSSDDTPERIDRR